MKVINLTEALELCYLHAAVYMEVIGNNNDRIVITENRIEYLL